MPRRLLVGLGLLAVGAISTIVGYFSGPEAGNAVGFRIVGVLFGFGAVYFGCYSKGNPQVMFTIAVLLGIIGACLLGLGVGMMAHS